MVKPIQIKPIAKNQFTQYASAENLERRESIYSWANWLTERNIPFAMIETENGLAIWKIPAESLTCEGCQKPFISHVGKRTLCEPCAKDLLKKLGVKR